MLTRPSESRSIFVIISSQQQRKATPLKKLNFVKEKKIVVFSLSKVNPGHLNSHGNNALHRNELANLFKYDLIFNHNEII